MGMLETARPVSAWGQRFLPEDRASRYLAIAAPCSLLVHALVGLSILFTGWLSNPVIAERGDLLFVDTTPEKPGEGSSPDPPPRPVIPAPRSIASPPARSESPAREARPAPTAPRVAEATPPRLSEPREAPRAVAPPPAPPAEEPAYEGRNAQVPSFAQSIKAPSEPPPQQSSPWLAGDTRVASVPQTFSPRTGALGLPGGGGGGFRSSQGGVVGQAVPLDTPDPNYREYMQRVRQRIYAKWDYPREARDRELTGRLVIEFHIGKDGQLLGLELVSSSGEPVLDSSALNAVKMAERYPPLPEAMQRDVLPVVAIFSYRIRTTQSSTFQLLQ
jgi:TonB family protein